MTDACAEFLAALGRRGHEPLLENMAGTMRLDLVDGEKTDRWLLSVDNGDVTVSHKKGAADCILRADRQLFDAITSGEVNAFAAVLRGALAIDGDPRLLVLFQRLLPSPPPAGKRRSSARAQRKK